MKKLILFFFLIPYMLLAQRDTFSIGELDFKFSYFDSYDIFGTDTSFIYYMHFDPNFSEDCSRLEYQSPWFTESESIYAHLLVHDWVYSAYDDLNVPNIPADVDSPCPYNHIEVRGRICSICLQHQVRTITVIYQKKELSEYMKLKEKIKKLRE